MSFSAKKNTRNCSFVSLLHIPNILIHTKKYFWILTYVYSFGWKGHHWNSLGERKSKIGKQRKNSRQKGIQTSWGDHQIDISKFMWWSLRASWKWIYIRLRNFFYYPEIDEKPLFGILVIAQRPLSNLYGVPINVLPEIRNPMTQANRDYYKKKWTATLSDSDH